jgi:hypothetical protein
MLHTGIRNPNATHMNTLRSSFTRHILHGYSLSGAALLLFSAVLLFGPLPQAAALCSSCQSNYDAALAQAQGLCSQYNAKSVLAGQKSAALDALIEEYKAIPADNTAALQAKGEEIQTCGNELGQLEADMSLLQALIFAYDDLLNSVPDPCSHEPPPLIACEICGNDPCTCCSNYCSVCGNDPCNCSPNYCPVCFSSPCNCPPPDPGNPECP